MAPKLKKPCRHTGCPKTTLDRYCEDHRTDARQYDNTPDRKAAHAFYQSREWRAFRKAHLKPLCEICEAKVRVRAAKILDHIKPMVTHPELRLEPDNVRSLCVSCSGRYGSTRHRDGKEL